MTDGSGRSLYVDSKDPDGYIRAAGRPVSRRDAPYQPVRLGQAPKRDQVLLFTLEVDEGDGKPVWIYEGYIPDPVPAKHYAQMLQDVTEVGVMEAEARMLNNVLGAENLKRLAECDALQPDDLVTIMSQVAQRAAGPYRDAGKA